MSDIGIDIRYWHRSNKSLRASRDWYLFVKNIGAKIELLFFFVEISLLCKPCFWLFSDGFAFVSHHVFFYCFPLHRRHFLIVLVRKPSIRSFCNCFPWWYTNFLLFSFVKQHFFIVFLCKPCLWTFSDGLPFVNRHFLKENECKSSLSRFLYYFVLWSICFLSFSRNVLIVFFWKTGLHWSHLLSNKIPNPCSI